VDEATCAEVQRKFEEITPSIVNAFTDFVINIKKKSGWLTVLNVTYAKWEKDNPPTGLHPLATRVRFIHGFSFTWLTPAAPLKAKFHFSQSAILLEGEWGYPSNTCEIEIKIKNFHTIRNIHIAEALHSPTLFVEKVLHTAENIFLYLSQDFSADSVGNDAFKTLGGVHRYASYALPRWLGGETSGWFWRATFHQSSCPGASKPKEKETPYTHYYINILRLYKPGITLNLPFALVFEETGETVSISFEVNATSVSPFKKHLLTESQPLMKVKSSLALYYQSFHAGVLFGELCTCASPKEVEEKVKNAIESLLEMLNRRLEGNPLFPLYTLAFSCIYTLFLFLRGDTVAHFKIKPPHFKTGVYMVDVTMTFTTANKQLFHVFVSVTKNKRKKLRAYVACRQMNDTFNWVMKSEKIIDDVESTLEGVRSAVKVALKHLARHLKGG